MHRSFPIALALAAFTMASVCGTASAISPTPATPPAKPPVVDTKRKLPAVQNLSTSTAASTVAKTKPKASATQMTSTSAAAVTTSDAAGQTSKTQGLATSNAATLTMSTQSGLVTGPSAIHAYPPPTPAADPKKDIAQQYKDIQKYEGYIVELQQMKPGAAKLVYGPRSDAKFGPTTCDSSGCVRSYSTPTFGGPGVTIKIRVDAKGNPLPGEGDKMVNAVATAIDKAIDSDTQRIANAKKQIDADYASLPPPGNGGSDLHRNGTVHQE